MVTVEDGVRLSQSMLWKLQREFFTRVDPLAWSATRVPSYITSNAFIARATARVAAGFLEDCAAGRLGPLDAAAPVTILELGAGSGRFAYGFVRELEARLAGAALGGLRARYVVTDLHEAPVQALRENPRFAPFVRKGLLDFAVLDVEAPGDVRLLESGDTLRADPRANPLAVVANYVFDGVPTDVFEVRDGRLFESHLRLACPETLDPTSPATLGKFRTSFEPAPASDAPYGDAELDALVRHHAERLADGHFLFPVAGLRLVRHLRALGGGRLLVLASDRGHVHENALLGLEAPHLARHGSFSLDVNFHAFAEHARRTGGHAFLPAHHPTHLATVGLLWGCEDGARSRASEAYHDFLEAGGPEDLYVLKKALERQKDRLDLERALAWLRASAWDGEVFMHCLTAFLAGLDTASPPARLDLLDAARHVRDGYYPIGEDRDVPYALGELFQALDALPEAESAFAESLRMYGATADVLHRLATCASGMHRLPEALARLEEALALDPSYESARAMRIAVQAEMKRRKA